MVDPTCLLDDAAMRRFIVDGYLQVQADLAAGFHARIREQIDAVLARNGNPGDDILPHVPELQQVFDAPAVRGALTSLLGPDYAIHPHRHCHDHGPGGSGQHWHKDDYVGDQNVRHHRFRWVMAFYYPQDVSADMGPTAIVPRRQFYNTVNDNKLRRTVDELEIERNLAVESSLLDNHDPALVRRVAGRLAGERSHTTEHGELPLCGKAGTVNLVNFDTWHRATANRSDKMRYMLKFQFTRMREPAAGPSWNSTNPRWQPVAHDTDPALSEDVWNWLYGRERLDTTPDVAAHGSLPKLLAALRASDETVCLPRRLCAGRDGRPGGAGVGRGPAPGSSGPVPAQRGEIPSQPGGRQSERALFRARAQRRGLSGRGRHERGAGGWRVGGSRGGGGYAGEHWRTGETGGPGVAAGAGG